MTNVPQFTIEEMQPEDVLPANEMRLQSWLDTYPNEKAGVTREWVLARNKTKRSPEAMQRRFEQMERYGGWLAKADDAVIGVATPYKDEHDIQHVGAIYVAKAYHGTGVGSALMKKIIAWSDPKKPLVLGVASYNERAKAFYRKWGFVEIPNSETVFENVIPEIMMERKGDEQ